MECIVLILLRLLSYHYPYASDELFTDKLKGKLYEENVGSTRFILCKIEELNNKSKETQTDLWARDIKNKYIWTIGAHFPSRIKYSIRMD